MNLINTVLNSFKVATLDGHYFSISDFFIGTNKLEVEYISISIPSSFYSSNQYLVPINTVSETEIANKTIRVSICKPDILSCFPINDDTIIDHQTIKKHWFNYERNSSIESHHVQATFFIRMREIDYKYHIHTPQKIENNLLSLWEFRKWRLYFLDGVKRKTKNYLIDCKNWKITGLVLQESILNLFKFFLLDQKHILKIVQRTKTIYLDQFGKELKHLPSFNSSNSSILLNLDSVVDFKGELSVNNQNLVVFSNKSITKEHTENDSRTAPTSHRLTGGENSYIH